MLGRFSVQTVDNRTRTPSCTHVCHWLPDSHSSSTVTITAITTTTTAASTRKGKQVGRGQAVRVQNGLGRRDGAKARAKTLIKR